MNFFKLLPVTISFLVLSAHFYRAGQIFPVLVCLMLILLMLLKKSWIPLLMQLALLIGAVEWLRTLLVIAQMRITNDMSWLRLAIILGGVALFTALSGLVFRIQSVRRRYSDEKITDE